jgi:hypothetical protein
MQSMNMECRPVAVEIEVAKIFFAQPTLSCAMAEIVARSFGEGT